MEFFERAHVAQKRSSMKENRSDGAVKKQLKQMLHAYKKGNNQEIKSSADTELRYDCDDLKSMSDFSDLSFLKEADTSQETVSSRASAEVESTSGNTNSSSSEISSSKSNETQADSPDSVGSFNEYKEEFKSLSSSQDIHTTEKDCSSTFDSSILSEEYSDSEISIPSSLQSFSSDDNDVSNDEAFDPNGELANIILEKLSKNLGQNKKRKLTKDQESSTSNNEKKKEVKKSLLPKMAEKTSKSVKKAKRKDSTNINVLKVETKKQTGLTYRNIEDEISDDSFQDKLESENSQSSQESTQFISVSASDMQSQSLSDIVGDYIYPTVKNLPSDKQNVVYSQSSKYAILDEVMNIDNVEDISSLIPEVDDDTTIEDLTLTDLQESVKPQSSKYAKLDRAKNVHNVEEISNLLPEINEDIALEELTLQTDQEPTEESTALDSTVQTEDYFEQESSSDNIEPTSVPIKVYSGKDNHILVMKHPAVIFIHGKVRVTGIGGSVEVFGYTLQDGSIDLYAPYCNIAYSVKTIANVNAFHGLFSELSSAGLSTSDAEEIVTTISEHDAVIALSKLNCPKMDFVDNNFTATELFTKRVDQTPALLKKVAENLGCSLYLNQPKRILEERSSWEEVVACGKRVQSRGIICGGKGTGKSTFLRYCVNRMLSAHEPVLVIDLDPGQAEFTMPGNISANVVYHPLIGPNFTHLGQPEKMLNIGMINPMDNPSRYISAVKDLISFCMSSQSYSGMPWIVNTMGMCNNMGLKIISNIIMQIQPTFVYQIDSKIPKKRFEFELQPHAVSDFYEHNMTGKLFRIEKYPIELNYTLIKDNDENGLSPRKGSGFALMPRDERYLNVLAYFGQLLDIYGKSILDIVPYEVHLRDVNIGTNVKIPEQAVMKVINGKIIALCQLAATDKGKLFTLDDKALVCHGYGLIRSIDFERELLFILSPVPIEKLTLVDTLVYADWMPDLQGQEKELPSGTVVPYRTATVVHERKLMFPPRRRFNPIQLLKATRSS